MARVRLGGVTLADPPVAPRVRLGGVALSGAEPVVARVRLGGVALSGAPAVVVAPMAERIAGPGELVTITPELASGGTADSWTWRRISGPTVTLLTAPGGGRAVTAPSVMPSSPTASGPAATIVLGAIATVGGVTSPERTVSIAILPQLSWAWSGSAWVGAAVVPYVPA